ncbi:MAG: LamG domain-containing protein, partial [Gemmatimonadales bacterium]
MKKTTILLLVALISDGFIASAQQEPWLAPSPDFAFLVAHLPQIGSPRWAINGRTVPAYQPIERFLLPADGTLAGTEGTRPSNKAPVIFEAGKWGSAFRLASGEMVAFPRKGILDLTEGGVEFWLSPHEDGIKSGRVPPTRLFAYDSPKGDFITIQVSDQGVIHGGAIVANAWESAFTDQASVRGWKSGSWHHVLLTWSASASRMRLYLDGQLMGDTNEGHYLPPDPSGSSFLLGSPSYAIDSVRIWDCFLDGSIAANAVTMSSPPSSRESRLALSGLAPGDIITCEVAGRTARYSYRGPPLTNPQPRSGLLPSGTSTLDLSLESSDETTLLYSVGTLLDFASMTPVMNETAARQHHLAIAGVSTDPSVSTDVYVRPASFPGYVLHLRYRDLPLPPSTFPRISNLWYDGSLDGDSGAYLAKLGLLVPSFQSPGEAVLRRLHRENPNLFILATNQSFEHFDFEPDVPESWYLRDTGGQRICM